MRLLMVGLIVLVGLIGGMVVGAEAGCWCHPLDFDQIQCSDRWEVWQGGLYGWTVVGVGTPPPEEAVILTQIPPLCPDPWCNYRLVDAGHRCLAPPTPVAFGLPPLSPERKAALLPFANDLQQRIILARGHLQMLQAGSAQFRGWVGLLINFTIALSNVSKAIADPPNPDYAHLPGLEPYVADPPLVADATLTEAQAAALNAWAKQMRQLNNVMDQANRTLDNLSGAVQAAQAGDVAAIAWARRLARAVDALWADVAFRGDKEVAKRDALAAAFPSEPLAGRCATFDDATQAYRDLLAYGSGLHAATLVTQQLPGVCAPAAVWPGLMTAPEIQTADRAWYAGLVPFGHAETVCTETGYCSSLTTITLSPKPLVGAVRQKITVTATGRYAIIDGLIVTVSAVGYPTQTLSLVGGAVTYKQPAPSGASVALTVTFPEQKNAKYTASTVTATVVVP